MPDEPRILGDILRRGVSSAQPSVPEPADPDATIDDHDPTGLDLASRIAQAATVSGAQPRSDKQRKRPRREPPKRSRRDDPTPLGEAVGSLIAQRGWTRGVNLKALLADWPGLVGQANADHSKPEAYVGTVLTVRADSTAWASSLRLLAPQLVAKLNAALGDGTITRIDVLGPAAPSWKHGLRVVRDGRGPRDTYG